MTDEQIPDGTPPDPAQTGSAPMGSGQPPPSDAPPPPAVNPYEQQPVPPPPSYGQPVPPPVAPYGQPAYGQPGMPAGFPGVPIAAKPSKALAITALVLALVICVPFLTAAAAIVLGLVVVLTSRPGRGLAIAAIVIGAVAIIGWIAAIIGLASYDFDKLLPIEQLKTGECLNASDLANEAADVVGDISEVSCNDAHDAEVLATKVLTQDDAKNYDPASTTSCTELLDAAGLLPKITPDLGYVALTTQEKPNAGDKLVCVAYRTDGSKLDAPL